MPSKLVKPEFTHQHRLGLVVYGGLSLAIYMNGICQEFYNAVRGRGIYKLIKALTDADIVVDIISGTSAGGINGVLLSYALANSQGQETDSNQNIKPEIKFEKFACVWKDSGDIQKLLYSKKDDGCTKTSFFDGDHYYKNEIKKALIARYNEDLKKVTPEAKDDWFSKFDELDLFVTGTNLFGRIYQIFDNTGCVIDVKDHQAIFHLKYQESGDNHFKPIDINNINDSTYEALAKLCQITSSFPVAFPPVTVKLHTQNDADEKLVKWGELEDNRRLSNSEPPISNSSKEKVKNINGYSGNADDLYFVDGGVLDNRPFSYTIKEIYQRRADRPVFRKLFYIDPSPDHFFDNERDKKNRGYDIVQVFLDSLIAIPIYESINNDLTKIKDHNQKSRRYKFLVADIEAQLDNIVDQSDKEEQDEKIDKIYDQAKEIYLRTRLISLKDNILPLIFLKSNNSQAANDKIESKKGDKTTQTNNILDTVAQLLTKPLTDPEQITKRLEVLRNLEEKIGDIDIDYTLRKYYFISDYVYQLLNRNYLSYWLTKKCSIPNKNYLKKNELDDIIKEIKQLIKCLNNYVKLLETIKNQLYKLFSNNKIKEYFSNLLFKLLNNSLSKEFPEKFYNGLLFLHGKLLDVELILNPENLKENLAEKSKCILDNLEEDLDNLFKKNDNEIIDELEKLSQKSILKQLTDCSTQKIKLLNTSFFCDSKKNKLLIYFQYFNLFDIVLFPLDYLSGVQEKQEIETYRISPEDAKLGLNKNIANKKCLTSKLAGNSFKGFGGFFKKSWRANDILWGRLDGLNRIVEALITEDKIRNFLDFRERQGKQYIHDDEFLNHLLNEVFPLKELQSDNDKKLRYKLQTILKQLLEDLKTKNNTEESSKKHFQNSAQELAEVLVHLGHLFILDQDLKETGEAILKDPLVNKSEVNQMKNDIECLDFMSWEEKEKFFCDKYCIGSKKLASIPLLELIKVIFRFGCILIDIFKTWARKQLVF